MSDVLNFIISMFIIIIIITAVFMLPDVWRTTIVERQYYEMRIEQMSKTDMDFILMDKDDD